MSVDADREIKLRDRLRVYQGQWLSLWEMVAKFCRPEKASQILNSQAAAATKPSWFPQCQNSTAMDALNILAGGCKSWLIPGGAEGWGGQWEPHPAMSKLHEVKDFFAYATEASIAPMDAGGMFTESHAMLEDLGCFGTAGLFIDDGGDSMPMHVTAYNPADFVYERDFQDNVSRVILTHRKSARELVEEFGKENVPEVVRMDVEQNRPDESHEVIQSIYKRENPKPDYEDDPLGMPFASCWIHVGKKAVMREGGYHEMPMVVPRWRKFTGTGGKVYGTSPAMAALADIRGVNLMEMLLATLGELAVNPRIKAQATHTGPIDLSPGSLTWENGPDSVKEWAPAGRYDVGDAIVTRGEQRIRRAFHADLFEQIAPIVSQRELTNFVADALQREAASRISPAMGRFATDFYGPAMRRCFMVLYRKGYFGEPPEAAFTSDEVGNRYFVFPSVVQTNRMSRVLNSRRSFAFQNAMGRLAPLLPVVPRLLDIYKIPDALRDLDRGDGMPPDWHRSEDEIKQLQAARAQQEQEQQAQQALLQAVGSKPEAVAKLAGIAA